MFALKLSRFSALGPMKYELMTWCGSVSLDGGDGILKIAMKMRIQPRVDTTAASLLRQLSSPGEDLDIYHPSGIPSLQRHHRGAYRVQLKPPALISCMRRHGGEIALCPMHGNGERKTCLCSAVCTSQLKATSAAGHGEGNSASEAIPGLEGSVSGNV